MFAPTKHRQPANVEQAIEMAPTKLQIYSIFSSLPVQSIPPRSPKKPPTTVLRLAKLEDCHGRRLLMRVTAAKGIDCWADSPGERAAMKILSVHGGTVP